MKNITDFVSKTSKNITHLLKPEKNDFLVFSGNSNVPLAQEIAISAKAHLGAVKLKKFSDGEIYCQYTQSLRGKDIFIVQSTDSHQAIMELLIMLHAARHAKAKRIIAVVPYFGYSRQDVKDEPRACMSGQLMLNLIEASGATHIILAELHNQALTNAVKQITFDHLYLSQQLWPEFKKISNLVVINLDAGGSKMARYYAKKLKAKRATADKIRDGHNKVKEIVVIGDVADRNVLIVDDLDDTSGTIDMGVNTLINLGAKNIYASCIHAVLSGKGISRLVENKNLKQIIFTNTLDRSSFNFPEKIKIVSVAEVFAQAIVRFHKNQSIDSLFEQNLVV